MRRRILVLLLLVVLGVSMLTGCAQSGSAGSAAPAVSRDAGKSLQTPTATGSNSRSGQLYTKPGSTSGGDISKDGQYNSKDDVARYIKTYGRLPSNYISKKAARRAGWRGGSLEDFFPGCSIGGDVFGNREGLLPKASGRTYYECDIDTQGKDSRGAKRIVYSNDGLIFYSDDHYRSFTPLYGKENER